MSKKVGAPEKLIIKNKRLDGRKLDEMRKLTASSSIIEKAVGSGKFSFDKTTAIAGVYGPKAFFPRGLQDPQRTILRCIYSMVPFSTKERIRPGPSRRNREISKVVTEALSNVIFLEEYPKTGIDVFIDVLQADASTRCAGLNAASIALADAGIPMRNLVCSCSVGKIEDTLVLDVFGLEDNYGQVDLAVATVGDEDKFVLMQMDGIVTREEFATLLEMAKKGCKEVYEEQVKALKTRYAEGELNE